MFPEVKLGEPLAEHGASGIPRAAITWGHHANSFVHSDLRPFVASLSPTLCRATSGPERRLELGSQYQERTPYWS